MIHKASPITIVNYNTRVITKHTTWSPRKKKTAIPLSGMQTDQSNKPGAGKSSLEKDQGQPIGGPAIYIVYG